MARWCGPLSRLPQNIIIPVRIIVSTYTRSVLLINLPGSKNRFVRAPIKCRRWRPPSHLYTLEFCRRFPVKERGFYTQPGAPSIIYCLTFVGIPSLDQRPAAHDQQQLPIQVARSGTERPLSWHLCLWCTRETYKYFHVLNRLLCRRTRQRRRSRERQDRVLDFIQILW